MKKKRETREAWALSKKNEKSLPNNRRWGGNKRPSAIKGNFGLPGDVGVADHSIAARIAT